MICASRGVVDDRRANGRARLRHQLPDKLPVESGEGESDAACLVEKLIRRR